MITNQIYNWHSVTLNDVVNICHFSILEAHEHRALYISVYSQCVNHKSTMQFPPLPSRCLFLFLPLPPFYPHPGARAFEEIQFEILSCIFHEPNLFLYPVCSVVAGKMFHWHCMGMPVVIMVCVYILVCASSLFLNPSGRLSSFGLKIQHDK